MNGPRQSPPVLAFETIDSTNAEAHRRAAAGERGPIWITAGRQEVGRGRSGRAWSSPLGNFSASFLFMPEGAVPSAYHQVSFISGVAVVDALRACGVDRTSLQLKWPNDLMIGDAKLGGILVESSRYSGDYLIIIGIGLNLAVAPHVPDRKVTSLAAHGTCLAPDALLHELASTLSHWLAVWEGGRNFAAVREAWLDRAHPLGQALTVNALDQIYTGTFAGLGPNGSLSLRTSDGTNVSLDHGDVSLVQQADRRPT